VFSPTTCSRKGLEVVCDLLRVALKLKLYIGVYERMRLEMGTLISPSGSCHQKFDTKLIVHSFLEKTRIELRNILLHLFSSLDPRVIHHPSNHIP